MSTRTLERLRNAAEWSESQQRNAQGYADAAPATDEGYRRAEWWDGAAWAFGVTATYLRSLMPRGR